MKGPEWKFAYFVTDPLPWCPVCTKEIFRPKGSYGYGESRNVFSKSVQYTQLPVQAVKIPRLEGGGIGPRTESCITWDGPIAMVPYLHQGNIHAKRKLRVWRAQKCIPLVGAKTILTCAGRQYTPSRGRRYRAGNEKLRNLGQTYRHGAVFAPRKYLCRKEATGMEREEMYSASRFNTPTYLCGPLKYPVSRAAV